MPSRIGNLLRSPTPAIEPTVSSSLRRMMITPCVWRPVMRTSERSVLMTWPWALTTINSSLVSSTSRMPISLPVLSVTCSVYTPWPPRWWVGYSLRGVSLP